MSDEQTYLKAIRSLQRENDRLIESNKKLREELLWLKKFYLRVDKLSTTFQGSLEGFIKMIFQKEQ